MAKENMATDKVKVPIYVTLIEGDIIKTKEFFLTVEGFLNYIVTNGPFLVTRTDKGENILEKAALGLTQEEVNELSGVLSNEYISYEKSFARRAVKKIIHASK